MVSGNNEDTLIWFDYRFTGLFVCSVYVSRTPRHRQCHRFDRTTCGAPAVATLIACPPRSDLYIVRGAPTRRASPVFPQENWPSNFLSHARLIRNTNGSVCLFRFPKSCNEDDESQEIHQDRTNRISSSFGHWKWPWNVKDTVTDRCMVWGDAGGGGGGGTPDIDLFLCPIYRVSQKSVHSTLLSKSHDPIGVWTCATAPNKQEIDWLKRATLNDQIIVAVFLRTAFLCGKFENVMLFVLW